MEQDKELNQEFKDEISKTFASLFKEIGNNRQQLTGKVLSHHKEIYKELNKEEVGEERKKEIRQEVSRVVKMASQQLPHLKMVAPKPVMPTQSRISLPPKAAPIVKPAPVIKPAPSKAKVAAKAKPVASKSKKTAPAKKKK